MEHNICSLKEVGEEGQETGGLRQLCRCDRGGSGMGSVVEIKAEET